MEEAFLSSNRQVRFPDVVYYVTFGRSTKGPKHVSLSLILFIAAAQNIRFIRALSTIEFFMVACEKKLASGGLGDKGCVSFLYKRCKKRRHGDHICLYIKKGLYKIYYMGAHTRFPGGHSSITLGARF